MGVTQNEKAARFRALHNGPGAFVIPNPWDVGSARILAGLGFEALATSSAASACALGRRDGGLTRDEALAHTRLIVDATDLPVSADLEKGFGDAPESWRKRSGLQPRWDLLDALRDGNEPVSQPTHLHERQSKTIQNGVRSLMTV